MKTNTLIEEEMYKKAIEFIPKRYPKGWGGVAVLHTEDDSYLISVAIETSNCSVELCIEVGAICEAHKLNTGVTHSLCVVRDDENSPFKILSPCGVCQERLRFWGADVLVAVTNPQNELKFVRLEKLQPYHWTNAYSKNTLEYYHKD